MIVFLFSGRTPSERRRRSHSLRHSTSSTPKTTLRAGRAPSWKVAIAAALVVFVSPSSVGPLWVVPHAQRCLMLVTAIANYTQRVTDTSLSATQRQEALKFIDHVR